MFVCQDFTKDFRQYRQQDFTYTLCNLSLKKCNTLKIRENYLGFFLLITASHPQNT